MREEEVEKKIKEIIVSSLDLEDLTPADIVTDAPLFGEGLGLDSIEIFEDSASVGHKDGRGCEYLVQEILVPVG